MTTTTEPDSDRNRGPVYSVELIDTLPLCPGGAMLQQMPSRNDLKACSKYHMRVAAAYEVLLSHYQTKCEECEQVRSAWMDKGCQAKAMAEMLAELRDTIERLNNGRL